MDLNLGGAANKDRQCMQSQASPQQKQHKLLPGACSTSIQGPPVHTTVGGANNQHPQPVFVNPDPTFMSPAAQECMIAETQQTPPHLSDTLLDTQEVSPNTQPDGNKHLPPTVLATATPPAPDAPMEPPTAAAAAPATPAEPVDASKEVPQDVAATRVATAAPPAPAAGTLATPAEPVDASKEVPQDVAATRVATTAPPPPDAPMEPPTAAAAGTPATPAEPVDASKEVPQDVAATRVATPAPPAPDAPMEPSTAAPASPDCEVPRSLLKSLARLSISTPKAKGATLEQNCNGNGSISFGPVTPAAAQTWMALLRRQSTDELSLPSPIPAAVAERPSPPNPTSPEPAAKPAAPKPVAVPKPTPEPVAKPSAPEPVPKPAPEPSPKPAAPEPVPKPSAPEPAAPKPVAMTFAQQLLQMDELELAMNLSVVETDPLWQHFERGVEQSKLEGNPLKILMAFELWKTSESAKPFITDCPQPEPKAASAAEPKAAAAAATVAPPAPPTPAAAPTMEVVTGGDTGETPPMDDEEAKKSARAAYMRYYRAVRNPKVPAPVAVKFREALADPTGKKGRELFAAYVESGENWLSSSIVQINDSQSNDETEGGRWSWLTRDDS